MGSHHLHLASFLPIMLQAVPSQSLLRRAGANTKWSCTTLLQSAFLIQIKAACNSLFSTPVIPFSVPELCAQGAPPSAATSSSTRRANTGLPFISFFFFFPDKRQKEVSENIREVGGQCFSPHAVNGSLPLTTLH